MNPLLLLLLGLGGLMSVTAGSSSSSSEAANDEAPEAEDDTPTSSVETVELAMVVHDLAEREVVLQIEDGEIIDFGTTYNDNYTFAAETADGSPIGSMLLEYQGQTWLQNNYPYTLQDSPLDLSEGTFDISVTAYSGPDASGDVIGTGTINFSTTSAQTTVEEQNDGTADQQDGETADPQDDGTADQQDGGTADQQDGGTADQQNDGTAAGTAFTMVVWDLANREIVEVIEDGESIDFGTAYNDNYTFAAETADGSPIGSMLLEYQGQTWLQNSYPYTLQDSPLDLSEGDFEVSITAYSGPNSTGTLLGTGTICFSTTSEASPEPVVVDDPAEPVIIDDPAEPDDTPDDEPDSTEDNDPTLVDPNPSAGDQSGDGGAGGSNEPIQINGTVDVVAGRVATLEPQGDDITALKIVSGLDHGNVSVNPDGTFAVVLSLSDSKANQSFTYEATHSNGTTTTHNVNLNVQNGSQDSGWGTGSEHYMLATDENDSVIVEAGENHTKIYVTGSNDALTVNDIAQLEGVSVNQVTGNFMLARGYGQSEDLAVNLSAGKTLWKTVAPEGSNTSTWLLMERGHEYGDIDGLIKDNNGESELHPLHVGAWGEGDKPIVTKEFYARGEGTKNVVIKDIQFEGGIRFDLAENVILDNLTVREDEMVIWQSQSVTVRNSDFVDIAYEASRDGGKWDAHADRIQGLFANKSDGLLFENNLFDHNGWTDGYDPGGSGNAGQPPSQYSHNMYVGSEVTDMTIRDTITMQGASYGLQVRSGGFFEDNAMIDNNIGFNSFGGNYKDAGYIGNYSLLNGNLVTSAGYKEADDRIGAVSRGITESGRMSTLIDNIVAHLADPNDPSDLDAKYLTQTSVNPNGSRVYDDTIIYNWEGQHNGTGAITEKNTGGLDTDVLDQTTIQNFTAQLLGDPNATIADLGDFLQAQAEADGVDVVTADTILQYFQEGFGLATDDRTGAETLRFVPNDLAEGVRWDNRMNWTTEDLPGTVTGDSVDLGGNVVVYNGLTTEIDELEFGPDGELILYGGKLTATGGLTTEDGGGDVVLTDAGQLWTNGHTSGDDLDVEVYKAARFANTGEVTDTTLTVKGGEAILATGGAIYGVSDGETLAVHSNWADVGFADDDGGVALLALEEGGTLSYDVENGQLGKIEEIESGAFDNEIDVRSGIDLGDGTLKIDLAGLNASNGTELMLMDADEIIGVFEDADISGLSGRNAKITIDYVNDTVSLTLSNGSGNVLFETIGQQDDVSAGEQALWDALTAGQGVFDDNAPDIPEDDEEYLEAS